jgi:hypothetical protein
MPDGNESKARARKKVSSLRMSLSKV